jgi:Domain of unknown function (DUF4116)
MSDLRARLGKIMDLHGQALSDVVGQRELTSQRLEVKTATSLEVAEREAQLSHRDIVLHFAQSDPTDGKSRTQWLIQTYIADTHFKLEDLGRAHAALTAFERFKHRLPREQRELSRLKSLQALEALVDPFVKAEAKARLERDLSSATGREKRRLEEWKARDESIVIPSDFSDFELKSRSSRGEGKGLPTIAVPMTEFAACWWGRGTRWCTAAAKNNAFTQYHKDAPLIIIVCPMTCGQRDGEKFQMHVQSDTFQFMDNTDTQVNEETIRERWIEFKSLLYWAVEQNGWALKYIPEEHRTPELCRIAVQNNVFALYFVPKEKIALELCRLAVEQNGWALEYVPIRYKTPELCRLAVEQDGLALFHVPEAQRTPELCRLAVEQYGLALYYVPGKYQTPELYRLAVEQNGRTLQHVHKDDRTPELCLLAVQKDGQALKDVPTKYITPELCSFAVQQDGMVLEFVPKKYRTPEICNIAIRRNGMTLQYVPEKKRSPELYSLAVEQDGLALQHVLRDLKSSRGEDQKTPELCRLAVEQNGWALQYVPDEHRTYELCRIAVEQNGCALDYVPKNDRTLDLCCLAVQRDGRALEFVPEEKRTPELLAFMPPVQPKWNLDILKGLLVTKLRQVDNHV